MICSSCGRAVASGMRFCGMCGKRQSTQLRAVDVASLKGKSFRELGAMDTLLDWRRAFEILGAACQAITDARARGVSKLAVEPESLYVEQRPGGWWLVTILDADVEDLRDREERDTEVRPAPPSWLMPRRMDYFSPERLVGKPLDGASDVYSLGVIAFELITGRLPFGARGAAGAMLRPPPAPSAIQPDARIPRAADAVLLACLDKDRNKRYADASMLAQAISHVLVTEPVAPSEVLRRPAPPSSKPAAKPAPPRPNITVFNGQPCGSPSCTTPHRFRAAADRTILGSWLYLDHFDSLVSGRPDGMAHPHHGVVSISYLFEGRLIHRDSLGNEQLVKPNTLSWLHAGRGVVHTERRHPIDRVREARLHGLELWVVLPRPNEDDTPAYAHHGAGELPSVVIGGARVRVVLGEGLGARSPVATPTPLSMFDVRLPKGSALPWPATQHHEYQRAIYVVSGAVQLEGKIVETRQLAVLSPQASVGISPARGAAAHVMLLGSAPLIGPRYTWWYFSTSSKPRIEEVKRRWSAGELGAVPGDSAIVKMPDR